LKGFVEFETDDSVQPEEGGQKGEEEPSDDGGGNAKPLKNRDAAENGRSDEIRDHGQGDRLEGVEFQNQHATSLVIPGEEDRPSTRARDFSGAVGEFPRIISEKMRGMKSFERKSPGGGQKDDEARMAGAGA
jgi:hypothetical protein